MVEEFTPQMAVAYFQLLRTFKEQRLALTLCNIFPGIMNQKLHVDVITEPQMINSLESITVRLKIELK